MKKLAASAAIIAAAMLGACDTKSTHPSKPERCGQVICATAWAQCEDQPFIILYVSSKSESKTPIKYTYKLFGSNGQVIGEGPGSGDLVKNTIVNQTIPFSGKATKVHALSGRDDIAIPAVTC